IVVDREALTELVRCAKSDSSIAAVGGQLMDFADPSRIQAAGGGDLRRWRGFPVAAKRVRTHIEGGKEFADLDWITGGNMLCPLDAIRAVGLIDESYFLYMEDIEHSLRMRQAGYRFGYAAGSKVWHKGGATVGHRSHRYDYYMVRNAL